MLTDGIEILRDQGLGSLLMRSYLFKGRSVWNTVTSRRPVGTNVFDKEWDVLILLDACRVDTLRTVSNSVDWISNVSSLRSVGSTSAEWVLNTFTPEYQQPIESTSFISRNVWSQRILDEAFHKHTNHKYRTLHYGYPQWDVVSSTTFEHYERVQPIGNQDDRLHPEATAVPHIVTDRAISVARETAPERMIVWYTLPHTKFISKALDWDQESSIDKLMSGIEPTRELRPEEKSYDPARNGDVSSETMYELYEMNLKLALKYVGILLENIDAEKVVISADHGEALGEHGVWGHPFGYPTSPVKTVPWTTTTATNEDTYTPQHDQLNRKPLESEQKQILEDMGYL